jgi:hypothetical protein
MKLKLRRRVVAVRSFRRVQEGIDSDCHNAFRGVSLIPSHGAAPTAYHGGTPTTMNDAPPGWSEWWSGAASASLGPDWLCTNPGASTSIGIDMNVEGGMEQPPTRGTSAPARGRGSSVP